MIGEYYEGHKVPESKKATCQICHLTDNTGTCYPSDLDFEVHEGFTIGKGKTLYWAIWWHRTGNCTVYSAEKDTRRYLRGDQEITIHFK